MFGNGVALLLGNGCPIGIRKEDKRRSVRRMTGLMKQEVMPGKVGDSAETIPFLIVSFI